jgi:16S rRNA (guanine(527)-N(7))-methyltransferase RsmG
MPRSAAAHSTYQHLPIDQKQQIDAYLDTLLDWNTRMNLTGKTKFLFSPLLSRLCYLGRSMQRAQPTQRTQLYHIGFCSPRFTAIESRDEAYVRHINDSLALLPVLDACATTPTGSTTTAAADAEPRHNIKLIDIGSGAGLPGIILAITRPNWHVTLLDSLQKRCTFNAAAVSAAALTNVSIVWARAEEAGQDGKHREQYDVAVARAVAEMRVLAEYCLPFVVHGGYWVAAKGFDPGDEVAVAEPAIEVLGGKLVKIEQVESLAPEGRRTAVVVRKESRTGSKYPRRAGVAKKQPL